MGKKLSFLDLAFWITESKDSPKHVAGLMNLSFPQTLNKDARQHYVAGVVDELRSYDKANDPFSCIVSSFLGIPFQFREVEKLDMQYHVQLHHIDDVDNANELYQYVAKLHEQPLDRNQPLWQYHLISSKNTERFAIYVIVHHVYGDGASFLRWFQAGLTDEPNDGVFTPVWAAEHSERKKRKPASIWQKFTKLFSVGRIIFDLVFLFIGMLAKLLRINPLHLPLPFSAKRSILTGKVKAGRSVATIDLPMDRIIKLSKRTRATINEVLLASFDIALRRYMKDLDCPIEQPLICQMPVNLRKPGEKTSGNKIGIAQVQLGDNNPDPYQRLRQIIQSHAIVKRVSRQVHPASFIYYSMWWQTVALVSEMLGLSQYHRPLGNILISNMPGRPEPLFYKDSEVLSIYPISALTPGGGINMTVLTYRGLANVGMVCCKAHVEQLIPLTDYIREGFELLEASIDNPAITTDDLGKSQENKIKTEKSTPNVQP